jgi:gas vesicle protein
MIFKGPSIVMRGLRMDQETREYLERILLGLTSKEDLEKLRQETKSNFRQLKEEYKNQILEWKQEVKADLEQLTKGEGGQADPMRKEFKDGIQELKVETRSALEQSFQKIGTLLQEIKEEAENALSGARQGPSLEVSGLKDGIESLREGIKEVTEEILYVKDKMKDGFVEVQTELGSMMRFSYADLERKFSALEARIKALEKMVFP